MKNSSLLFIAALTFFQTQAWSQKASSKDIAIGNIKWGMTKIEVKEEFKANKSLYTNYKIGNTLYRYYWQNNWYDDNGGLIYVNLTLKGGGMGTSLLKAKTAFRDILDVLDRQGFKSKGYPGIKEIEFATEEIFEFQSKELGKTVTVKPVVYGRSLTFNVGIKPYNGDDKVKEDLDGF